MPAKSKDNFIFRRQHRRLTYTSIALILPVLLTLVAALMTTFFTVPAAVDYLELVLALPPFWQMVIWLVLPIIAAIMSRKGYQRGTLYGLRTWNRSVYWLAILILSTEALIVLWTFI